MKLLLDSQVLLWWFSNHPRLKPPIRSLIEDLHNAVFVSAASVWEIEIKNASGKLPLPGSLAQALFASHFRVLPITLGDGYRAAHLPPFHKDPFDRMIIAQAARENLTLLTSDAQILQYPGVALMKV